MSRDDPQAAVRFVDHIEEKSHTLAERPNIRLGFDSFCKILQNG